MENPTLVEAGIKGGSAPKHRWTEEEKLIVRRDYAHTRKSAIEIAERLGVTEFAVKGQVSIMGLGNHDNRHPWTPKEDAKLRRLLRRWGPRTVAKKMHRSLNSVVLRAKRINIVGGTATAGLPSRKSAKFWEWTTSGFKLASTAELSRHTPTMAPSHQGTVCQLGISKKQL